MKLAALIVTLFVSSVSFALTTENWSMGFIGGVVTANEADMNSLITRANTRVGGISTGQFANAYELGAYLQRRFNGSIFALQLRPTYFTDWTYGTGGSGGSAGDYNYSLSGVCVMPLIRAYILESQSIKLYIQGGIGYGYLSGKIQEAGASANFSGDSFGFQGGIGVNFCFGQRDQHCVVTEGNLRYMSIARNTVSSTTGSFASGSLSQYGQGQELEVDNHDLATTMSGVQGIVGYQYNF